MSLDERHYVKVKSRKWQLNQRIMLPLSIGSDPSNRIIVNSEMAACVARVISTHEGRLVYFDPAKKELTDSAFIGAYGFSVSGPYPSALLFKGHIKRFIQELFCREAFLFQSLPATLRHSFGGFLPQNVRLLIWGFCLLSFATFFGSKLFKDSDVVKDRSREVLQVAYASYFPKKLGSAAGFREFKRGATLSYDIPPESRAKAHVLSFDFKDNDIQGELTIKVGGKTVFVSELDKSCVQQFCPYQVLIPEAFTNQEHLTIFFQHNFIDSDYVLKQILLERIGPLRPEEAKTIERWLASAQRFFDERVVAHGNILKAKEDVERVIKFLRTKEDGNDYKARANSLAEEINAAIDLKVRDLWFAAQQNIQLGKYVEAKEALVALKIFISSPADPRFAQIGKMTRHVEEFLK